MSLVDEFRETLNELRINEEHAARILKTTKATLRCTLNAMSSSTRTESYNHTALKRWTKQLKKLVG